MAQAEENEAGFRPRFYEGEVLFRLASTYDTLQLAIVEAAQNAVDAGATRIFVGIDLRQPAGANDSRRQVIVVDNGEGITTEKMRRALSSIGHTLKDEDQDEETRKLGRFGLGMISPVDKCARFEIISQPSGATHTNMWTLVGKKIRGQEHFQDVPFKRLASFPGAPRPFGALLKQAEDRRVPWRTMIKLGGVTGDKAVNRIDLDELEKRTLTNIGEGMRRNGVVMHVTMYDARGTVQQRDISPEAYTGEPLQIVQVDRKDCGTVEFELYRVNSGSKTRRGVIVQQAGDPCAVSWRDFSMQARGWGILGNDDVHIKEAFGAIASGAFEGVIRVQRIKLAPERTKFVRNDALIGAYVAIIDWYNKFGKAFMEAEHETRRDQRLSELGQQSLDRILEHMRKNSFLPILQRLMDVLPGVGNTPPAPSEQESAPSSNKSKKRRRVVVEPSSRTSSSKKGEPDPGRNTPATGGPVSLRFGYEMLPTSDRLFEFDFDTGTITFNIRHPQWEKVDSDGKRAPRHDKQVMSLQEWLAFKVLVCLARNPTPSTFEDAREIQIDVEAGPYIDAFILA